MEQTETMNQAPATIENKLAAFSVANEQVLKAVEALAPFKSIATKEESEKAIEVMKSAAKVSKLVEDKRKELVGPLNDDVKKINGKAKLLAEQVDNAIAATKQAVLDWQKAEATRIWEETKKTREAQLEAMGMKLDENRTTYVHAATGVTMPARFIAAQEPTIWSAYLESTKEAINQAVIDQQKKLVEEAEDLEIFATDEDVKEVADKLENLTVIDESILQAHTAPTFQKAKGAGKRWVFEVTEPGLVPRDYLEVNETKIRDAVRNGVRLIPGVRIYQDDTLTLR